MRNTTIILSAVEGIVDEAVVRRLIPHVGAMAGVVYGKRGKQHLQQNITRYHAAARQGFWFVLTDLDRSAQCAPELRVTWLPHSAPNLCFRIAVRTVEAWLIADRHRIARFLGVPLARIPFNPDTVDDPKELMVNLARRSRNRSILEDMVPTPNSGRKVGSAYASRLIEYVENPVRGWRPDVAAQSSDSLRRCLNRLNSLAIS